MSYSAFSIALSSTINSSLEEIVTEFDKTVSEQRGKTPNLFDAYLDLQCGTFKAVFVFMKRINAL